VVAFLAGPGDYRLQVSYVQHSWLGVGDGLSAQAAPITFVVR
jgi:hypothetical protein